MTGLLVFRGLVPTSGGLTRSSVTYLMILTLPSLEGVFEMVCLLALRVNGCVDWHTMVGFSSEARTKQ